MTKKTFTFLIVALFVVKVTAQQVEQKQRTLLTKVTASWCPNCGTWGWNLFEGLIEDNEDEALLIAAHYSGDLVKQASKDLASNFGATYQPQFFLNGTNMGATSGNIAAKRMEIKGLVDAAFGQMPVANVGFAPVFGDNKLTVDAKVKFFQPTDGEYYLSMFLLQDGLISFQSSIGNNASHKKVLVDNFADNTWGQLIVNGAVNADAEFNLSFELPINEVAGFDYEVAGIIWKKEGDKYVVVNVWSTKEIGEASDVAEVGGINAFEIMPNVTSDQANIVLDLENNLANASMDVFDVNGRLVANLQKGDFPQGKQVFDINRSVVPANGLYFVRLTNGKNASTQKIVFTD